MKHPTYKKYLIRAILVLAILLLGTIKLTLARELYFKFAYINEWFCVLLQTITFIIIGFCYYILGFLYNETLNGTTRLSISNFRIKYSFNVIAVLTLLGQLIDMQSIRVNVFINTMVDLEMAYIINIGINYSIRIFMGIIFMLIISNVIKQTTDSQWRIYNLEFMKDFKSLAIILVVSISGGVLNYYMNIIVFSLSWEINRMQSLFEGLTIGSIYIYSIYRNHKGVREKV